MNYWENYLEHKYVNKRCCSDRNGIATPHNWEHSSVAALWAAHTAEVTQVLLDLMLNRVVS
jgi:hypothetical protein